MMEIDIEKNFKGFSLDLQMQTSCKRVGILGASGCGKSLTLKSIAGIETPDRGRIAVDGRCVFDSAERINVTPQKRRIGYLFQNYALFPTMTVEQNVAAGVQGNREERRRRTREMLEHFQLEELARRLPGELSGGQQQRVALARIIAYGPELILLDEPFSALDVYLKEQLQQEMRQMLESYEGTVLLVSHSRDEIYQFSEELLVMDQGKAVRFGTVGEVFAHPGNVAAARLTGCKNISAAERTGKYSIYAKDWGLTLRTEEEVGENVGFVGIRAHDIERAAGGDVNCLPCRIASVSEAPFERIYLIRGAGEGQQIWWKVPKNRLDTSEGGCLPEYLRLPPERLMLLES